MRRWAPFLKHRTLRICNSVYFRYLAESLLSLYKYLDDQAAFAMVWLRVRARELCCYPTPCKPLSPALPQLSHI
jgi:hypothetical protein